MTRKSSKSASPAPAKTPRKKKRSPDESHTEQLAVVGIGASAGGLAAFKELFESLPADTGLAFVLVQHLAPTHPSSLPEILARVSKIPVKQASDGDRLEANTVSIIPPAKAIALTDGHITVTPRKAGPGLHLPIDIFFKSLADACGQNAIGIVLSGTGADGSSGVEAIRLAGGITIAQDPDSATHPGMPLSAIDTGVVDFVLKPKAIAAELARIGRHERRPAIASDADDAQGFDKVLSLLHRKTNVDFRQYKSSTVRRRVLRRLLFTRCDNYDAYVSELQKNPAEVEALYHSLLIGVTNFFRDPEVFESLETMGFAEMFSNRSAGGPVRVWVPGCAGGEEAYSIGMSLIEYLERHADDSRIQIFGTDLSEVAIAKARSGLYPKTIAADVSAARLARFFTEEQEGYRISREVRELCVFARQDITRDPPFSQMDMISCRNMLIYLEPFPQKRLFRAFHYSLKSNGILLLGTAESVIAVSDLFAALDKRVALFRKLPARIPLPASELLEGNGSIPSESPSRRVQNHPSIPAIGVETLQRQADRVLLSALAPNSLVVDDLLRVVQVHGNAGDFLRHLPGTANLDVLKLVKPGLVAPLRDCLKKAGRTAGSARREVNYVDGKTQTLVALEVVAVRSAGPAVDGFIVMFWDAAGNNGKDGKNGSTDIKRLSSDAEESELDGMRSHLQDVIEGHDTLVEELRAANEEIQSSNEELQSTNEELETAKEELQSTNEELKTTNEAMRLQNVELQKSHADLANVFISADLPLVLVGNDLRIRRFTHATSSVLRIVPTDVGRLVSDLRIRVPGVELDSLVREVVTKLQIVERKVKDESGRWWLLTVRPYITPQQVIDGAVVTFFDIDASEQHVLRIDESRAFAESVVTSVRHPFVVIGEGLRIELVNEAFYELFGVQPGKAAAAAILDFERGPLAVPGLQDFIKRALERDIPFQGVEVVGNFGNAGPKILLLNGQRLRRYEAGSPRMLLGIDDVTLQRNAMDRLRFLGDVGKIFIGERNEREILNNALEAVVPGIAQWSILYVDDRGKWIRHAEFGDLPPRFASVTDDYFVGQLQDLTLGLSRSVSMGKAQFLSVEGVEDNHVMAFPMMARGTALGVLIVGTPDSGRTFVSEDLTMGEDFGRHAGNALDGSRLYEAAQLANLAKTEFLATMSHELRTPLNAIQGYVQLLDMELHGPLTDSQRMDVGRIRTSQQHLTAIISQVLEFARIEAGHLMLSISDIVVHEVVSASAELIEGQMVAKELNFDWSGCGPEVTVKVDRQRVEQILLNLLSNAMKFTPQGGKVTLSCTSRRREVMIQVRDSGSGILPEKLESIFAPFIQLDVGLTRKTQGTGLGLTISREFAEAMGGSLTVESAQGYGSVFSLTLPRGDDVVVAPPAVTQA